MSFILDALKKSETDRQRQSGPALFEVKVAPPKAGFPVWAIAIVVLLVINMAIVGWMLLRRSSKPEDAAQNTPPPAASQQAFSQGNNRGTWSPSVATIPPPTNMAPQGAQYNNAPQQPYGPQGTQQWQQPQRGTSEGDQNEPTLGGGGANPGRVAANENGRGSAGAGQFGPNGNGGGAGANGTTGGFGGAGANGGVGGAGASAESGGNPDDFAPAKDPGSPLFKGHVTRGTASGLMLYQDLAVANGANLPELRLDMHVYDPKPQARFALINMRKVTEGQMAGDGVKVEAITPEGVVLSHNGTKFLLPRD
jgi:general secretion pathway protein B